jgi:2-polyprenyl-6-methoxyphenol hydroxylase-like FAD-dependent oxidoreductase
MNNSKNHYDVIIIGGGPAGASAAAILCEYGHRVLVLERETFPRYHVGESMIPFTFQPMQRLGLVDVMKKSAFQKKYSVQFVAPNGKASQPFYFFNRYDRETVAQTWQVLRSEFDVLLLDHARKRHGEGIDLGQIGNRQSAIGNRQSRWCSRATSLRRGRRVPRADDTRLHGQGKFHGGSERLAQQRPVPQQGRGVDLLQRFETRERH